MADIRPFRALRYDPAKVKLEDVLTQPYDKITPAMQDAYYQRSPHNLVRYELGKAEPTDVDGNNVYNRAKSFITEQLHSGVLVRDALPYYYAYRQRFEHPLHKGEWLTRTGFIGLGRIYDYDEGVVFRHEQTLSKPKADRLNLLRAARTHSGQIFMLFEDPDGKFNRFLEGLYAESEVEAEVVDEYGVTNQLCPPIIGDALEHVMAKCRLIIADGHHRYETALTYRNEQRAAGKVEGAHDWLMMTFVSMSAPGLIILPTHRVVFGMEGWHPGEVIVRLREFFDVEPLPSRDPKAVTDALADAGRVVNDKRGTALAMVTRDAALLLRAHPDRTARVLAEYTDLQRQLDVLTSHKVVLEHSLAISEDAIREQRNVRYHRWAADAIRDVDSGANAAFLMNAVPMDLLRDLTFAGTLMPQKSTDFYPKLLSGLTLYSLDESFAGESAFGAARGE
jgi:uncharacterized protein (DUF1015 family)